LTKRGLNSDGITSSWSGVNESNATTLLSRNVFMLNEKVKAATDQLEKLVRGISLQPVHVVSNYQPC
jgi:hypothetical protein